MKINENMAIGFLKNDLILIMFENDGIKRLCLYDKLNAKFFLSSKSL